MGLVWRYRARFQGIFRLIRMVSGRALPNAGTRTYYSYMHIYTCTHPLTDGWSMGHPASMADSTPKKLDSSLPHDHPFLTSPLYPTPLVLHCGRKTMYMN